MSYKNKEFQVFKKKMNVAKSLVNDVQTIIHLKDFVSATSLLDAASKVMPTDAELAAAKKQAPLRMALRGESKNRSSVEQYRRIVTELRYELAMLKRDAAALRKRTRSNRSEPTSKL